MKAYHIMMFLLIFNVMLWIISIGLGIYDLGYQSDIVREDGMDFGDESDINARQNALLNRITNTTLAMALSSILGGAIIGLIAKEMRASQYFVYSSITSVFWITYINTFTIFLSISESIPGGILILTLFTAIIVYIFLVGLYQMVTGGWKSYV
jgi:ABC-type amino acid transport system permease subunit